VFSQSQSGEFSESQRLIYFLLANSNRAPLAFYPSVMAEFYTRNSEGLVRDSLTLFVSLTAASVAITLVMTFFILPIILRIESNKERVFITYAELNKQDLEERKRNIRLFFMKLRQSTNNPGGSLFWQKSSRIVSSRLLTKKFSLKDDTGMGFAPPLPNLTNKGS